MQYQDTVKCHQELMVKKENKKHLTKRFSSSSVSSIAEDHQGYIHQDCEVQLREEKLELDRQLSHLILDKEILVKNQSLLHQQIEQKTEGYLVDRSQLVDTRNGIQVRKQNALS